MIDKKWKWVARDEDGRTFVFNRRPTDVGPAWGCAPDFLAITGLVNLEGDWKDSLHEIIHHEDGKIEFRKARPELKVDAPVLVKLQAAQKWSRKHFACWDVQTGLIRCWDEGRTSFTAQGFNSVWDEYKLP